MKKRLFAIVGVLSLSLITPGFSKEAKKATPVEEHPVVSTTEEMTETQVAEPEYTAEDVLENMSVEEIMKLIGSFHFVRFPLPEKYRTHISSPQGLRDSIEGVNASGGSTTAAYHYALDIACPDKTPVYAAFDGYARVVYPSYYNGPYEFKGYGVLGGYIEIVNPESGLTASYSHMSYTGVKEGEHVTAGQTIGWSGGVKGRRGSGSSTGPHLHFCIYFDINNMFLPPEEN